LPPAGIPTPSTFYTAVKNQLILVAPLAPTSLLQWMMMMMMMILSFPSSICAHRPGAETSKDVFFLFFLFYAIGATTITHIFKSLDSN
jgi:hypothetical protein